MRHFIFPLLILNSFAAYCQKNDTSYVYFDLNQRNLDNKFQNELRNISSGISRKSEISIIGYADFRGTDELCKEISADRAKNVARYLVASGVPKGKIKLISGYGKIDHEPVEGGVAADRKVMIVVQHAPVSDLKTAINNVQLNETIRLSSIHFVGGLHQFLPESKPVLDSLADLMKANPKLEIQIEGHICCLMAGEGNDKMDMDNSGMLSETRAKAVYNFLVQKGIAASRMKYAGLGYSRPIVKPEKTEQDQINNRRVEIRILKR
jgi:outer membrane protein OmpA-like peptidoglycan-associated protein